MSWFTSMMSSGIGKKLLMALTGLFLISFLVIHMTGNLQLFQDDGGYAFNKYAKFMTTNPLIKTVSYLLYATILIHAVYAFILIAHNKSARPSGYQVSRKSENSSWASRNMGILGTIILIFIVIHLSNFWFPMKFGYMPYAKYELLENGDHTVTQLEPDQVTPAMKESPGIYKDLYASVSTAFEEWWLVALYLVAMIGLAFHLAHGFSSAFQTLGLRDSKYYPVIHKLGIAFAIVVPALFAAMPLYFLLT